MRALRVMRLVRRVPCAAAAVLLCLAAAAQGMESAGGRDPTLPPAQFNAPAVAAAASSAASAADITPIVIMSEGRYYVMDRGRRLGVGDLLGTARIARIDDNGVWLREADSLEQIPLHGTVVRKAVPTSSERPIKNNPNR
jgi:hypothetical protein